MRGTPLAGFWFSLLIALLLQLLVLPDAIAAARPLWLPLVLVYWALTEPRVPAMVAAFVSGLALDVLLNAVLGQHAMGLVLLVYFVARLRAVFVLFPLWQSTLVLMPAWFGFCLLMAWIDHWSGHRADAWLRWLPALSTTLFWPLIYGVMDSWLARRRHRE